MTSTSVEFCNKCKDKIPSGYCSILYCSDDCAGEVGYGARLALQKSGHATFYGTAPTPPVTPDAKPNDVIVFGKDGYYRVVASRAWGSRHERVLDPTKPSIKLDELTLPIDFAMVPAKAWNAWTNLAFRYFDPPKDDKRVAAPDSTSEVSVILARKRPDLTEWRVLVPRQTVGAASVDADLTQLIDILTGEELRGLPEEWAHAGSSHSHQSMGAFFSGTDDRSELTVPGLHIVVGELTNGAEGARTYLPLASIVQRGKRYIVPFHSVVDTDVNVEGSYHPKVLDYVTKHVPTVHTSSSGYGPYSGYPRSGDTSRFFVRQFKRDATETTSSVRDAKWLRYTNMTLTEIKADLQKQRDAKNHTKDGVNVTHDVKGAHYDVNDADAQEIEDVQKWLHTPGGRLVKRRGKDEPNENIPLPVRLAMHQARQSAGGLSKRASDVVRAFCNAIDRAADDPECLKVLRELAQDVALWPTVDEFDGLGV